MPLALVRMMAGVHPYKCCISLEPAIDSPRRMKIGSVFLILLGLGIAAIGGVFSILMWQSFQRAREMHNWPQVQAVILSSEIEEWQHDEFSPMEYRMKLLYGYEWMDEAKTGERLTSRGNPWSNKKNAVTKQLEKFPKGAKTSCYVNPARPDFAVLKPDSKAAGYSIWFPGLFVVGGIGIVVRAALKIRPARSVH
ncbi:MAG: DUF3592 domain-containing protein [Armatimonadetes bacterium]|nr:DUF3592 domain-containing protein [Akkermansiaceae bacterium]